MDKDSAYAISNNNNDHKISVKINDVRFYPGNYYISLWASSKDSHTTFDYVRDCLKFKITDGGNLTQRRLPREAGLLFLTPEWSE